MRLPIVPDDIPARMTQRLPAGPGRSCGQNEIVKGKFLSDDGRLALIVMALDRGVSSLSKRLARGDCEHSQGEPKRALAGSDLRVKLTGAPVMQLEIRNAVERDRLVYNGLGFVLGALATAFLFFRQIVVDVAGGSWTDR